MAEKTITLHIRVPEGIAEEIRKVARETNTPQGTALKYLIEQARNEQLETRLIEIEENQKNLIKSSQELVNALHSILPKLASHIVHDDVLSLVNQRQIQQKLPLDKENFEDLYALYLYEEHLKGAEKQFEHLEHTNCGGYQWVVRERNRLGKGREGKKGPQKKAESREHVR